MADAALEVLVSATNRLTTLSWCDADEYAVTIVNGSIRVRVFL